MRLLLAFVVALALLVGALWLPEGREARSALRGFEERESEYRAPGWVTPVTEADAAPLAEPRHGKMLEEFEAARRDEHPIPAEPSRLPRSILAGRVGLADGAPAVGARVELECSAPFRSRLTPLAEATAREDGSFRLEGPGSGPFRVAAYLGLARVERDGLASGSEGVELVLPAPCALALLVVDDRGQPLEAFRASARRTDGDPRASADARKLVVHDGHGAGELADLCPGEWRVLVESPGLCSKERVVELPGEGPARFVLPREARVTGRVLDERGEPVAAAEVEARVELDEVGWVSATRKSTCDAQGGFTLSLSPSPVVELFAQRGSARSASRTLSIAPGQELELELGPLFEGPSPPADGALERAAFAAGHDASVRGRVTDTDGAPVAGLALDAFLVDGFARRALTDAEGAYRLDLAPGRFRVRATASAGERAFESSEQFVRLARGESRAGLDFTLEPAAVITGWVRYPPGWADGMAQISVRDGAQADESRTSADEHGRFRVAPLNAGLHWVNAIGRDALGRPCCTARTFFVEATAGQTTSIALELVPATVLSVFPAAGTEMPREAVFEAVDQCGLSHPPARLDGEGRWQFVLAARDPVLLRARYCGRMFERELSFSPGEVEFEFPLK